EAVARAVGATRYWFVIGGQAVRCLCPYRPSRDVDFGVVDARTSEQLLAQLRQRGKVELIERGQDTLHLTFDGIDVSIFVLPELTAHVHNQALDAWGLLATKIHVILDRGLRRDFFDLYVLMDLGAFGLADCLRALREVYQADINEGLLLRALVYFDDADAEAPLPREGQEDWATIKSFFQAAVGALIAPPRARLSIQSERVDVAPSKRSEPRRVPKPRSRKKAASRKQKRSPARKA